MRSPPLASEELETIWRSATRFYKEKVLADPTYVAPATYGSEVDWDEPIAFDNFVRPPFPVDALPDVIKRYVVALSESTQTPVDMAATSALAVLAVAMQGKYKVRAKADWVEPVNLFVLNVMEPSERKSAVESAMVRPLNVYEQEENLRRAKDIELNKMRKNIIEKKKRNLEDALAKGKKTKDTGTIAEVEERLEELAETIANFQELHPLKLYVDDITTEKLTSFIAENQGRAAILSTEGGIFDTLAGSYSKSVNIDVLLKGYSGDTIRVDRIGRSSEMITDPSLTILLMIQPTVLDGLISNGTFRGRGLTARFLYCIPKSYVGRRKYRTVSVPAEYYESYERLIKNILEDTPEAGVELIGLSAEADTMIEAFAETLEPMLKKEYEDICDWAGKLVGNVIRIAALLTRASRLRTNEFLDAKEPLTISGTQMGHAIEIGQYLIEHAKAAFAAMGQSTEMKMFQRTLRTLQKKEVEEFSVRELMRICRFIPTSKEADGVVQALIDYGYLAEKPSPLKKKSGRPRSPRFIVSPLLKDMKI